MFVFFFFLKMNLVTLFDLTSVEDNLFIGYYLEHFFESPFEIIYVFSIYSDLINRQISSTIEN